MPGPGDKSYYRDQNHTVEEAGTGYRYVIAIEGKPVIKKRSSGSDSWLVYRNEAVARRTLYEVQLELPEAEIVDLQQNGS